MTAADPLALPAHVLAAGFRAGTLDPEAVTDACLARIRARDGVFNAMWLVREEAARAAAAAAARRWRRGRPLSPLDGVPITVKDNIATTGDPTPAGVRGAPLDPAPADAPPAARIREAGLVILGKTTMPDYGMLAAGVSSLHGVTRNPRDPAMNTAGSSSGAGAALAAGYAPLALGTDIGGSVRAPAAACGVAALKPSFGRVPIDPPWFGRTTGPMARTVRDLALLLDLIARPDRRDFAALPPPRRRFGTLPAAELAGLRLGLLLEAGAGLPTAPEVRDAVGAAARRLEAAGARVIPVGPVVSSEMMEALDLLFRARTLADLETRPASFRAGLLPFVASWAEAARGQSALALARAIDRVFALRRACVAALEGLDALLTPALPILSWPAELPAPSNDPARPWEHLAFLAPFNQSEQPALVLPAGCAAGGLPVGLQIVGRRFDDRGVLAVGLAVEAALATAAGPG